MGYTPDSQIELKSSDEVKKLREAGKLLATIVNKLIQQIKPGVITKSLDTIAYQLILESNAQPSFLGYRGFPATLCTSINEEIVHGIPSERKLKSGDLLSLDMGLSKDGFYSDMAVTVPVGDVREDSIKLIEVTQKALHIGIENMCLGNRLGDISSSIQRYVESFGYSVVREYSGHGIGRLMHEPPQVLNYGKSGTGPRLKVGMVFAIEPMVNEGDWKTKVLDDEWTVVTLDGSRSAHFEHTVALTENGPEILTLLPN